MAFVFLLGVIISVILLNKKVSKNDSDLFLDYSPTIILFSIIGARLFYVLASFEFYFKNPKEIIMINHGGLSIFGAIIFGILTFYFLSKKNKFDFLIHIDVIAVTFPLCQAIGRFGNFFNQEAYGAPYDGFLKLFVSKYYRKPQFLDVEYYHPAFLYESFFDLIIFFILLTLFFKNKKLKNGSIAAIYLILYSIIRFFIEGIRIDSVLNLASIPIAKIISIIIFILGLSCLIFLNKKHAQ